VLQRKSCRLEAAIATGHGVVLRTAAVGAAVHVSVGLHSLLLWTAHTCTHAAVLGCLQGVLKVATLPDGASWIMPSPEHQECVKVRGYDIAKKKPVEHSQADRQEEGACRQSRQRASGMRQGACAMPATDKNLLPLKRRIVSGSHHTTCPHRCRQAGQCLVCICSSGCDIHCEMSPA
jgi:hypothetical protein